jgi:malonate-semialdehyde dehydrogenase (acetylating)/methylmalonate-semialdehyde dehydrogenase
MTTDSLPIVQHYVDGTTLVSASGRTAPVFDPALGVQTKSVALANQSEIDAAVASAKAAFPAWSALSITRRQQIIFTFRELLNQRKGELAEILTAEHGKVLSDAVGEITRGLEVVELATGFPHLIKGEYSENVCIFDQVAARRRGHHLAVQLSGDGADVVLPYRHRGR